MTRTVEIEQTARVEIEVRRTIYVTVDDWTDEDVERIVAAAEIDEPWYVTDCEWDMTDPDPVWQPMEIDETEATNTVESANGGREYIYLDTEDGFALVTKEEEEVTNESVTIPAE